MTPAEGRSSSGPSRRPGQTPGWTLPRVLAAAAALLLVAVWVSSGSLVMALLVLVFVAGVLGLGVLVFSWATRGPRPVGDLDGRSGFPLGPADDDATTVRAGVDAPALDRAGPPPAGAADRVRGAVRGLLARPWVRGDALVRVATARLASEDALVWTPRGQRVTAPHLWVEWNAADLTEVAARWPLDVLARELADGYLEQARGGGARQMADRTWVHLLLGPDVPVGRVMVTAAFSRPQRAPVASACSPTPPSGSGAAGAGRGPVAAGRPPRAVDAPRPPAMGPSLLGVLVAETPGARDVVLAADVTVLGRDPHGDAVVEHPGVSWRHLTITRRDGTTWLVDDAGSTNGTTVRDTRIAAPTPIRDGDLVGLGHDGPHYRLALRSRDGGDPTRGVGRRAVDRTRVEVA